jgi:hypothetical protein
LLTGLGVLLGSRLLASQWAAIAFRGRGVRGRGVSGTDELTPIGIGVAKAALELGDGKFTLMLW